MKKQLLAAMAVATLTGCGGTSPEAASNLRASGLGSSVVAIEGSDADLLIDALFQSGVRDASGRLGPVRLKVDAISCSAPVVPDPTATCSLMILGDMKAVATTQAGTIFQLLKAHGARVPQDRLGIDVVAASAVDCQRSAIRNGISKCSLTVAGE